MLVGIDRLPSLPAIVAELAKSRVGLLAHPASVTRNFTHTLEALEALGIMPRVLFGPEHGWAGHAQDMIGVDDGHGAPSDGARRVVSLYGEQYDDLLPKYDDLRGLDVVVIDLQDIGSRYYTFVWTAVLMARACHKAGVRVLVLDRPNPLGSAVEGRLQEPELLSFVGLERLPIRHGLTVGQIVSWRAKVEGYAELVTVVAVRDLDRAAHASSWDRPFVMPSPNMPTYDTTLVYPGGCLLEGTNLSDGRGTTRPFEITGAPWVDANALAEGLRDTRLPGFIARPIAFEPTFHKHARQTCGGVQIHVTDARTFRPVATYTALVAIAHHRWPDAFRFRTEKYEFVDTIPAFDLLTGSAIARQRILNGDDPRQIADHVSAVGAAETAVINEALAAF